jgi:hypothetical protein
MLWHNKIRSIDGLVWHAANSRTWAHIDAMWLEFVVKPRNVKLALAIDGINPFSEKSNSWSS